MLADFACGERKTGMGKTAAGVINCGADFTWAEAVRNFRAFAESTAPRKGRLKVVAMDSSSSSRRAWRKRKGKRKISASDLDFLDAS